jgi:hypothetical protein
MRAFEVFVNGRHLATAGVGPIGVMATTVTWVGGSPQLPETGLYFKVGGVDGTTDEHLNWQVPAIDVGDIIAVRVVDTGGALTKPIRSRPLKENRETQVAELKRLLRELEEQGS